MKTVSLLTTGAALFLALGLAACLNSEKEDEHAEDHALYVMVRDSAGALVAADTVHWSLLGDTVGITAKAAHGGLDDAVKHGAVRVSDTGSVWKIKDHLHGSFYIRVSRDVPHPTEAGCRLQGYTVSRFHADSIADTVSLTMNARMVNCITVFPD